MIRTNIDRLRAGDRVLAIDGLRGIAVLLVVFHHYIGRTTFWQPLQSFPDSIRMIADMTWCGVDLFFVLSGFLIGGILLDHQNSPRLWRTFWIRRAGRILPVYLLLIAVAFFAPVGGRTGDGGVPVWAYFLFVQNLWESWGHSLPVWLRVTWSLAIEEQFYWLAPPVMAAIHNRRALLAGVITILIGSLGLRSLLIYLPHTIPISLSTWSATPCRLDSLAWGVLGAWLVRNTRTWGWLSARPDFVNAITLGLCASVLVLSQTRPFKWSESAILSGGLSLLAACSLLLILVVIVNDEGSLARLCESPLLTQPGKYSYFIYLFHLPILMLALQLKLPPSIAVLAGLIATAGLARLSWRFYEQPFIRLAHRTDYGKAGTLAAAQPFVA